MKGGPDEPVGPELGSRESGKGKALSDAKVQGGRDDSPPAITRTSGTLGFPVAASNLTADLGLGFPLEGVAGDRSLVLRRE